MFPAGRIHAQPAFRLAQVGRWRKVDCLKAREMSQFGLYGVMASLLVGIALNVPVRTLEFLGSIRSEEHTSELQSLMRISYAVFCLQKKTKTRRKTSRIPRQNRDAKETEMTNQD